MVAMSGSRSASPLASLGTSNSQRATPSGRPTTSSSISTASARSCVQRRRRLALPRPFAVVHPPSIACSARRISPRGSAARTAARNRARGAARVYTPTAEASPHVGGAPLQSTSARRARCASAPQPPSARSTFARGGDGATPSSFSHVRRSGHASCSVILPFHRRGGGAGAAAAHALRVHARAQRTTVR